MEPSAAPGTAISVVRRTRPPAQYAGEVSASRDGAVAVRFENPPKLDTADEMLLIIGPAGARWMATGRFVAAQGNAIAFSLTAPWQPLDVGKAQRRALDRMVEVRSVLGQSRQKGYITDISLEGVAVVVASKPGGSAVELVIARDGFTSHVRCAIASVSPNPEGVVLSLSYQDLSPPQQAFIRRLVASATPPEEGPRRPGAW